MAVPGKPLSLGAAILPDEINSPQLCEGDSCNRANAFARSVVTIDSAQIVAAPLQANGLFGLSETSVPSLRATNQLPPTSATLDPLSISLRI
jgi:hypothetical protein